MRNYITSNDLSSVQVHERAGRTRIDSINTKWMLLLFECLIESDRSTIQIPFLTFRGPCIVIYSYNKTNEMHYFSNLCLEQNPTCFGQFLFIIRSLALNTQQEVYVIQVMLTAY